MPDPELTPLDGQGQVQDTPPVIEDQGVQPPVDDGQGYFHSYTDPVKNEVTNFKTQDELNSYIGNLNKSYGELRKKFTQSTQGYADDRRRFENDRAELLQRQAQIDKTKSEIEKFDKFLKANPHIYREIKAKMNKGPSGSDISSMIDQRVREIYGPELEELKAHKTQSEASRQRDHAFAELQRKYSGANKETIMSAFNKLKDGNLTDVYEMIYLATGGTGNAQAQQVKQDAGILPSATGSPSAGKAPAFKDIDAWVAAQQSAM